MRHPGPLLALLVTALVALSSLLVFQGAQSSRLKGATRTGGSTRTAVGTAAARTAGSTGTSLSARDLSSALQGDEYDVQDYTIDIAVTPDSVYISGDVVIQYVAGPSGVSNFQFNLDQPLMVDSLTAPVSIYEFTHQDDVVNVFFNATIPAGDTSWVRVYYRGVPPPASEYGTLYFYTHGSGPVIYSISWPDNARSWWPCKDDIRDKATATILVTAPDDLTSVSNGTLVEVIDNGNGTKTSTWREAYPVTTYNICIAVSNYEVFTQYFKYSPTDSMPLPFYVWPEDRADAEEDWEQVWLMTAVYDSVFGEYPFLLEKYGMVETSTDPFAAMEHQTITSWGNVYITGTHQWDEIVAHELAHSWWGNSVTPAVWEEIWLSEGFATYSEAIWHEYLGGLPEYLAYMRVLDSGGFSGPLYDPPDLLSETVYNKGAWVVHMLRWVVGDSAFFEILPAFANDPGFKYDHASTPELENLSETISGIQLGWFFDEWVYGVGRPHYLMNWDASDTSGAWEVSVTIDQVQPGEDIFIMPLELLFVSGPDSAWERIDDTTGAWQGTFDLAWEPESVSLDPRSWVLKLLKHMIHITTTELNDAYVGTQYYAVLRSEGGVGGRIWSIEDGSLPDGLELTPDNGLISGVPAVADSFAFLVRVTDTYDPAYYDEAWLSILVHEATGIEDSEVAGLPRELTLGQNFPNPFNPETVIEFSVPARENAEPVAVLLEIYDVRGRKVKTLIDRPLEPGRHRVSWNGITERGYCTGSGIYVYVLRSGTEEIVRKMIMAR